MTTHRLCALFGAFLCFISVSNLASCSEFSYDPIEYADFTTKIDRSIHDGPGADLFSDIFPGHTAALNAFKTQFILDLHMTLGVNTSRVFVLDVKPGNVHWTWPDWTVIVTFRLYESLNADEVGSLDLVHTYTALIQEPTSLLYTGNVTRFTDPSWGLQAVLWDASIRLAFAIEVVGGDAVKDGEYLNQGSLATCDYVTDPVLDQYCDFEALFENDIAASTEISQTRVQLLFVKRAALDSVIAHFRVLPAPTASLELPPPKVLLEINNQLHNTSSALRTGNVTTRIDTTWGVSKHNVTARDTWLYGHLFYSDEFTDNPWQRCRSTHRCNWGGVDHNQTTNSLRPFQLLFDGGLKHTISHFSDFDDWRIGSRGWRLGGQAPEHGSSGNSSNIPKAHFNVFEFDPLGPTLPALYAEENQGLMISPTLLALQVQQQDSLVQHLQGELEWIDEHRSTALRDGAHRFRHEVVSAMNDKHAVIEHWYQNEVTELRQLNSSQCQETACVLTFNTSSLLLTGTINDTGVIGFTEHGTEVAMFNFASINLGPEVQVHVVGQRALALYSRSSIVLNTSVIVTPGTLGGFPGGGSVARRLDESEVYPTPITLCMYTGVCSNDSLDALRENAPTNNVNGPGSGNLRVHSFVLVTSADDIDEVQQVKIHAVQGQNVEGQFRLRYRTYMTRWIEADVTGTVLRDILEEDLNPFNPRASIVGDRSTDVPGIGRLEVLEGYIREPEEIRTWDITFKSAIGETPTLVPEMRNAVGNSIVVSTIVDGNYISGTFELRLGGAHTRPLSTRITADEFQAVLLQDLPGVKLAYVERTSALGKACDDGLCQNGPTQGGGLTWSVYLATTSNNITPTSPTSPVAKDRHDVNDIKVVQTKLTGVGAEIAISFGLQQSESDMMQRFTYPTPFSLAWGGCGGSHGGRGGKGHAHPYNGQLMTSDDLLAGSGGCMGGSDPFMINLQDGVYGAGGAGGGAVELVAANDVLIGVFGEVNVNGGDGQSSSGGAGGGGSGGEIVVAAGGIVTLHGKLSAMGGHGGSAGSELLRGGGGGGGRITVNAQSIVAPGKIVLDGGLCGVDRVPEFVVEHLLNATITSLDSTVNSSDCTLVDTVLASLSMVSERAVSTSAPCTADIRLTIQNVTADDAQTDAEFQIHEAFLQVGMEVIVNVTYLSRRNLAVGEKLLQSACQNPGQAGAVTLEELFHLSMSIVEDGAEGTPHSLQLTNKPFNVANAFTPTPNTIAGPRFLFEPSKPSRISFYVKAQGEVKSGYGAVFSVLHASDTNKVAFGMDFRFDGVLHDTNFVGNLTTNATRIYEPLGNSAWYKWDIFFNWTASSYRIHLGDVNLVETATFNATGFAGIELNAYGVVNLLIDQIFVGDDNTMGFQCPTSRRTGVDVRTNTPQTSWKWSEVSDGHKPGITYHPMQRHLSHIQVVHAVPLDGEGHNDFVMEGSQNWYQSQIPRSIYESSLLYVPDDESNYDGGYVWYRDHQDAHGLDYFRGSVGACSSRDLITWRFEGLMLHFTNLSDMVFSSEGPFHVQRPQVIFNPTTRDYTMWATFDNDNTTLAMAMVATSPHPDGPFAIRRTFYPDGNETRDHSAYITDGTAILSRTYFSTVDYFMPEAVMQPIWESVRNESGATNFRLTYHRAYYDIGYDNYHDIYLQRWRKEDKLFEVYCVNLITGQNRSVPYDTYNSEGAICNDPDEYKVVVGIGDEVLTSRFVDPQDEANSFWMASSVPAVKAQPWKYNVIAGICGLRATDDGIDDMDPALADFVPTSRQNCSNFADNPPQATPADKLIGVQRRIESFRTAFTATSRLSPDYLDSAGVLQSAEGSLENGQLLQSVFLARGAFGMHTGDQVRTTFQSPISSGMATQDGFDRLFHQYEKEYNDRAFYSLACVIDGDCPVDFKTQIGEN